MLLLHMLLYQLSLILGKLAISDIPYILEFFQIGDQEIYIYGAFWDYRNLGVGHPPYIRVLLIGPFMNFYQLLRQTPAEYYYSDYNSTVTKSNAPIYVNPEAAADDGGRKFVLCRPYYAYYKPPNLDQTAPKAIVLKIPGYDKLVDATGNKREWLIPIRGEYKKDFDYNEALHPTKRVPAKRLMACVRPMYGGAYLRLDLLLNFLVYMWTMGTNHFVFFDAGSASPIVYELWKAAEKVGISIEILPWQYRRWGGWQSHQTMVNELCAHKAMMDGYENMLAIDIDELIVPIVSGNINWNNNLPPLVNLLDYLDHSNPMAAMYCFWDLTFPAPSQDAYPLRRSELLYLHRKMHDPPLHQVEKCICKPYRIHSLNIHRGKPISREYDIVTVPDDIAMKHHYRDVSRSNTPATVRYEVPSHFQYLLLNSTTYRELLNEWRS